MDRSLLERRLPRLRRVVVALAPLPVGLGLGAWYLTEPLPTEAETTREVRSVAPPRLIARVAKEEAEVARDWPDGRLAGVEAKRFLLEYLREAQDRLESVPAYTATFSKQERMGGKLGPVEKIDLKVRRDPFSVYMRFLTADAGKEVIYQEGRFDDDLLAHYGGLSRRLLPRLKVSPTSRIALANSRHPITESGLYNLVEKLLRYRELDLGDEHAETILDQHVDGQGRLWHRAEHLHAKYTSERPFMRCVVLFDPVLRLPLRFDGFDWPEGEETEPVLGESYTCEDLRLHAPLGDVDFDPANPAYEFTRF